MSYFGLFDDITQFINKIFKSKTIKIQEEPILKYKILFISYKVFSFNTKPKQNEVKNEKT